MSHVTAAQLSDWMNLDFDAAKRTRAIQIIQTAERYVTRRAGWDFFNAALPDSPQSVDWVEVVCRVAAKMFRQDNPGDQQQIDGPYQTERNADYQYTKLPIGTDLADDPHISRIIAYWRKATPDPIGVGFDGPSKHATKEYDPDVEQFYDITPDIDLSRWGVLLAEE